MLYTDALMWHNVRITRQLLYIVVKCHIIIAHIYGECRIITIVSLVFHTKKKKKKKL